jgi:hypothetical protein
VRRRLLLGGRVLLGALALAAAAALAVFAGDVLGASSTMKQDDLRFQVSPDARGLWQVDSRTPGMKSLLGLEDDLAWRVAAQRFQLSRARSNIQYDPTRTASRASTQAALAEAERQSLSAPQASRLANFAGIVAYEEAVGDPQNGPLLLRRSTDELRRAVRLDPANEEAKFNLELLLELLEPESQQRRDRLGVGAGINDGLGSGAAVEGRGY